jgi:guanylate kinase
MGAKQSPLLIVLSGPSGVGKDAALSRMRELEYPLYYVVTATTRPQRPGEKDKVDYYFLSEADFQGMIERGELLEWAQVYGHLYGVPKQQVEQALVQGQDVMIKVDVQGAATIKHLFPGAVLIFLAPPSVEELAQRLRRRQTESTPGEELRLKTALEEMKSLPLFDYVVVNHKDEMAETIYQIEAIITAEKCRVKPTLHLHSL